MTMSETIENLSMDAQAGLLMTKSTSVGTKITALTTGTTRKARTELLEAGLIGSNGGLTIRGSAVAMKLQNAQLDALFGPE